MKRGFKAEAERLGARIRSEMRIPADARIDVDQLAAHLGVKVRDADQFVPRSDLDRLNVLQDRCFSAATFHLPNGSIVAVVNPVNATKARRDSDLAHEIAHLILGHTPSRVERLGDLAFFDCDSEQEEEANWLAGCLLLPRPLLLKAAREGQSPTEVADRYAVSIEMARFRLNTSGAYLQVRRAPRSRY